MNGQTITAPEGGMTLIRAGELREVSITPVAADKNTAVKIAAKAAKGRSNMDNNDAIQAAYQRGKADGETEVRALAADIVMQTADFEEPALAARSFIAGHPADPTEVPPKGAELRARLAEARADDRALKNLRARSPQVNNALPSSRTGAGAPTEIVTAALLCHLGREDVAIKAYSANVMQAARDTHCGSFVDVCRLDAKLNGRETFHDTTRQIRASGSTASTPGILSDALNKILAADYQIAQTWRATARVVNTPNYHAMNVYRLNVNGRYDEVPPGGEIKHGTLTEESSTVTAGIQAKMYSIPEQNLVNDSLGAFQAIPTALARNGARAVADAVYTALLGNADGFFSTEHANTDTGAPTALSFESLAAAIKMLRAQVDADGRPIDLVPKTLLVPIELEVAARQLILPGGVQRYVADGTDNASMSNPFVGMLAVEAEPRLSNAQFTGHSATGWYLFSNVSDGAMLVSFLDGQELPQIEVLDPPPNELGIIVRGTHRFGVGLGDYRAAVLMPGA